MSAKNKINSQDAFFKGNMEYKEVAISCIETFFPENISRFIDTDSLELDSTEYTDENLKKYFSDIVYNCKFKGIEIKLTLLFEHKSYYDRDVYFQLLRYIVQIWERQALEKDKKRIPILPIVFYNGERGWKARTFYENFDFMPDELKPYTPSFEFILTDLTKCSDEFLETAVKSQRLKVMSLLMKHIREDEYLSHRFREILSIVSKIDDDNQKRFLELFLNYLLEVSELDSGIIEENRDILISMGGNDIMTLAEKIEQKGIEKGIEKGREEGVLKERIETAKKMLLDDVEIKFISKYTGLSIEEIEEVRKTL